MDTETLNKILKAGKVAAQVREEGLKKLSLPGTSYLEVMDYCEKRVLQLGAELAWAQFATNDVAAHDCCAEDDRRITKEGDLIKVDIGTHLDGYIADNARTIICSSNSSNSTAYSQEKDLIKAAENALKAAIKLVKPGTQLWQLGEAQYSEAEAMGFTTVTNLCGHTLNRYVVHGGVSIPTFNNKDKRELQEDWQIAIEPFITAGHGLVKEKGQSTVFMVGKEQGVRSPYARKILDQVKLRKGLPFTHRDLTRNLGKGAAAFGLKELLQSKIVRSYPPLAEVTGAKVAQAEHSMVVKDKPIIYTKIDG
ncbi:type II methionyl aminopeptidase [Candidatus Woesearchaeota archaeon]|nr:type II methionyl aminopeptidase [Candidatus Woesearchaeota archaeon]